MMASIRFARDAFGRFGREERASLSVEAALIAPLLFWAFLATFTYFEVYRAKNVALKSNYAISDLLSRETNTIDMNYLNGARNLYRYLTRSGSTSWLRVTVVHCTSNCTSSGGGENDRTLAVDWSKATDSKATFSDDDIMNYFDDVIPLMGSGERVIIVETSMDYTPPFSAELTGIGDRTFSDIVMTRPRFVQQLCFAGIGCGA